MPLSYWGDTMYIARPMRLGNFSAVLEMLGDGLEFESDDVPLRAPDGPWRSSDQVQYAFDNMPETGARLPPGWASQRYGEAPPASANSYMGAAAQLKAEPPPRAKSDLEIVTEELRLESAHTAADLKRIRRRYALHNHPDRVPPALREEATRRMTIANTLIDCALKNLPR